MCYIDNKRIDIDWCKEGDKFKRPSDTVIQVIEEVVIEEGETCVHHHDINDYSGCGWCSSIDSFKPKDKIK